MPSGTPTTPDIMVTTPKMNGTEEGWRSLSSTAWVSRPRWIKMGPHLGGRSRNRSRCSNMSEPHQDRAPVQKVTQVKPRVVRMNVLFPAR